MMPLPNPAVDTDFIKPRLRVFLSVDLIGSTQFKMAQANSGPGHHSLDEKSWWPNVLMEFYTDFQKKFLDNWAEWTRLASGWDEIVIGPAPKLWKALGDELIFSKTCLHVNEVWGLVQVWRKTIIDFKATWNYDQLKFKSGAWLVGSPVRNREIAFLREPASADEIALMDDQFAYNFHLLSQYYDEANTRKIHLDFIGPSMDCGFRLLAKADERKFILSADLVFLLRRSQKACETKFSGTAYPPLRYYFDGVSELKGIARYGVAYPLFWLDAFALETDSDVAKYARSIDRLSDVEPIKVEKLDAFLMTYLDEMTGFPEPPYIEGPAEANGNRDSYCPEDHQDQIAKLRSAYLSSLDRIEGIRNSAILDEADGAEPTSLQTSAIEGLLLKLDE